VPLLHSILYQHDVEEVLRIRPSERIQEDFIAWFYDKSGVFSVKSAYHLAVQVENRNVNQEGTRSTGDGSRPLYNEVWIANVPTKVKIFAWRLAKDGLATQEHRKKRTLERVARCQVCGTEDESGHHAVINCTRAVALRHEMRKHWDLPKEEMFRYTGPDWLILLLRVLDEDTKAITLLLFWRVWHHRNDIIHGKGKASIGGSAEFLKSYVVSLKLVNRRSPCDQSKKGKEKIQEGKEIKENPRRTLTWGYEALDTSARGVGKAELRCRFYR
jgi:hypothetical protein